MALESLPKTPEEVCSRAMVLCGMEPLSSFNETDRDEVIVASQLYELIVADNLSAYPWVFATGQQLLELSATDPLDRFENAWHYPTLDEGRPLQIQRVTVGDEAVTYDIVKDLIYANQPTTAELVATYQYRVEEAYWLPQFSLYTVFTLAATFATSVTRNDKQISKFGGLAEQQFMRAKLRDSQSKSPKRARTTALRRPLNRWPKGDPSA